MSRPTPVNTDSQTRPEDAVLATVSANPPAGPSSGCASASSHCADAIAGAAVIAFVVIAYIALSRMWATLDRRLVGA